MPFSSPASSSAASACSRSGSRSRSCSSLQGLILFCALAGSTLTGARLTPWIPGRFRGRRRLERTREGGAVHTLTTLLTAAVAAGTPLLFAALGEVVAERAGVINLGIEGMMLVGAVTGFLAMNETGSLVTGVAASLAAGAAVATVHAFFSITLRANQIISGLGITIAGTGLAALLGRSVIGVPARASFDEEKLPLLGSIPGIGEILFDQHVLVYVGFVLAPVVWWTSATRGSGSTCGRPARTPRRPTRWACP